MIVGPPVAVLQINKDGSIHWLEKAPATSSAINVL